MKSRIPYQKKPMQHLGYGIGLPIDGILGHHVFQKVLLTYDYPAGATRR